MNKWRCSNCKLTFYAHRNICFCSRCGKELIWHGAVMEKPKINIKANCKHPIYPIYEEWVDLNVKEEE